MKVLSKDVMGSLNAASAAASRARQAEREKLKQDRREERKRIQDAVQAKDWRALPTPGERRRARKKLKRLARKSGVSNLQVLCADCNLGKGAWDATDWRPSP